VSKSKARKKIRQKYERAGKVYTAGFWLANGDPKTEVQLNTVIALWSKLTAINLLDSKFNPFYPSQAKTNDSIESKKTGKCNLRPSGEKYSKR
jgi:hypothetical protein